MTKLKTMKSIDAMVEVIKKGFKHLEVIVESLNDKVEALEAREIKLEEHIDMLITKLKSINTDKNPDKLELSCDKNVKAWKNRK